MDGGRSLQFRVLGPVQVARDGGQLALGGPKPRALLVLLLLQMGRPVSRDRLIDELWAEEPPATAAATLHMHLTTLRRALGPRLRTTSAGYVLDAAPDEIDMTRFELSLHAARGHRDDPGARAAALREALALWRGPAFEGTAAGPSAQAAAARLHELQLGALEDRAEADLALGMHEDLVAELSGLVEAHPTRERLVGHLMLALHRSGRGGEALAVFRSAEAALAEALGVAPAAELVALASAIQNGDPTLAAPGPATLPTPTTSFVGRWEELAMLRADLEATRLLTLVGTAGAGKSRLALELARRAAAAHPDGVHLVGLAALGPGETVGAAVASLLGIREAGPGGLPDALEARLRHGRALLVLDNCEHVAAECAALVLRLLEAAPGLRVLATSREALAVPGERVVAVGGLALPPPDADPALVLASDAVRLLAERATAIRRPGLALGLSEVADAAALVRCVDGLPLAIELAAARLRGLGVREVAALLEHDLDLPGAGVRELPERHRTMVAAIDWSHRMIDEPERVLLRRLVVFAGGFSGAAALALADVDPPVPAAMDVLLRLVDRSLVAAEGRTDGTTRYRLLEVVRQFALRRLRDAGEEAAGRDAHAAYFHAMALEARGWGGSEQRTWLYRLRLDVENLRGALGWCLGAGGRPDVALEMASSLWWYWQAEGRAGEGRTWLHRTLAAAPDEPSQARALGLRAAGALARAEGDLREAVALSEQALTAYRAQEDLRGIASAYNSLCISAVALGDLLAARRYASESVRVVEATGDPAGLAASRVNLGVVLRNEGDLDRAAGLFEQARAGFEAAGDRRGAAAALFNLSFVARRRGEPDESRRLAHDALGIYRDLALPEGQVDCLESIAALDADAGEADSALTLLAFAAGARRRMGVPMYVPDQRESRRAAEAAARAALSRPAAAELESAAAQADLADLVHAVLRSGARDDRPA